jgi:hypothetical protein
MLRLVAVSLMMLGLVVFLFQVPTLGFSLFGDDTKQINYPPNALRDADLSNPDYFGPEEATEDSKTWVKRTKAMTKGMTIEAFDAVGLRTLKEGCSGMLGDKLIGKYNKVGFGAGEAQGQICNMFVSNSVVTALSPLKGGGFATDDKGRLIIRHTSTLGTLRMGASKGKSGDCMNIKMARKKPKEFGKNPETLVAWELYNRGIENLSLSMDCNGPGAIFGF